MISLVDARGLRVSLPVLVGHWPFAIAYALVARSAGLSAGEIMLMSASVFAGASQMIVVTIMSEGVFAIGVLAATTLLVNIRHLLMGVSFAPHLEHHPMIIKAIAAHLMIDESFALTMSEAEDGRFSLRFFFTVGLLFYANWLLMSGMGILLAGLIEDPMSLPLDFVMPITFMVLIVPFLRTVPGKVAATAASLVSLVGSQVLPGYWYVVIAAVVAAVSGTYVERHQRSPHES